MSSKPVKRRSRRTAGDAGIFGFGDGLAVAVAGVMRSEQKQTKFVEVAREENGHGPKC